MCRAQVACGKGTVALSVAVLTPNGRKEYGNCVDRDLSAQRANAGVPSRDVSCTSEKDGNAVVTDCKGK